ncbi:hypothetical protein CLAIMM_13839 [Cladophialophora immunda]|nr:hypothetical protein CLAIMM_13839 [Cladophialophora immunda]
MSSPTSKPLEDTIVQGGVADPGETKVESTSTTIHIDNVDSESVTLGNFVYNDGEEEPELHIRTWIAYGSMLLLIYCQNMSLSGPPSVLIAAQTLIGFGFAGVPLTYSVPSEILPRKWRPMAQGVLSLAASLSNISGPLIGGALTTQNAHARSSSNSGWRKYFWIEFAIWAAGAMGVFFGYRPPKRHTRLDHLSFWQKLGRLDLLGSGLLISGLVLLLVGLNLGGNLYAWTNAKVLVTLILGIAVLGAFGAWEWKGTKTGIMSHDMFQKGPNGRTRPFPIYVALMCIEGIVLFTIIIFYPIMTTSLFTTDALKSTARLMAYWVSYAISTPIWGYVSTRFRVVREPLAFGFLLFAAGIAGLATIEPGQSFNQLAFAAVAGFGFGAPIVLIIAGVQLSVPHHLLATATAVINSSRAVGATIFTSIYGAALSKNLSNKIPRYLAEAATKAGLPASSIPAFIGALAGGNQSGLSSIPGVNADIIAAGSEALKQAYADSIRTIFIIGAPFGALACALCFLLSSYKNMMSYRVEAPVEQLHAKHHDVRKAGE